MTTLLVKNASIIDGTGKPAYAGHLMADGDRIRDIFTPRENLPEADTVVDAEGQVLCPGFIDMHAHADWILALPDQSSILACLVEQGVTTVVGGNCGFSPAPAPTQQNMGQRQKEAILFTGREFPFAWQTVGDFLDAVAQNEPIVNLAQLVGHASIRMAASENKKGALPAEELTGCQRVLEDALDQGACGLSFGLGYEPGMYAPDAEIDAFCRTAAAAQKPVTVHMKAYSRISPVYPITTREAHNLKALRETLDVARRTGATLQISHFIFVGRKSWPSARQALQMVDKARSEGVDVMIDAFPFTAGNTLIDVLLPAWFLKTLPHGFSNPWLLARLRLELEIGFRLVGFTYPDFQILDAVVPGWEHLNGMTMDQVARQWNLSPFKALLHLSRASEGKATMLFHAYSGEPGNEAVLDAVLAHPCCLFETDAIIKGQGLPNPSALGTFPKILGTCCRERRLFAIEDAVFRMTGACARRFGLVDRGTLVPGKAADLVIFDPETVNDTTSPEGTGRPKGIRHVFINGRQVVSDGACIKNTRCGRVLRT
ncbi:N-acyl-D-amino-acid deacylase [Desulfosarcina widdelii]|uniref:N-acyl-D-amino-acid deacylase n=1 Tax=Desulfosarcina widdelii TaxID=947919 RepID=A0A5K7ZBA7_9BACT|nr:amidohydrolase family protein [Desulfosarcina widdelii]BBO77063.1 N-acyl-D-amino-acid deacylase [Desulfosarcina widdelii]